MKTSGLYSVNMHDAMKGFIVAIGSAIISALQNTVSTGSLDLNWRQIGLTALAAGLSYLAKNFFTEAKMISHEIK